ncbi:isocitrate dehydrogenase [NAD] subunit gamma, mitochondrial isoform X2 [Strongylocentrotus purpuratus]|uniref:Isocitrate dehydrogenase [NAD] subunit, mitochondrial n=1 Tax=Strongylocentrotus purpuratus TaxID=7668 RepID=A0A7M7MY28_STRPU|nr:isocitrate dehydrogenase [NAD] subunit gamma, mitochondrial isoform X2 [Strongylocentrotus purpuratus]
MATSVGTGILRRVANFAVFNGKGGLYRVATPSLYEERKQCMSTGVSVTEKPPPACYGGRHTVTLIPGDGIGPELMLHLREVFRHAHVPVDFEEHSLCGETNKDSEEVEGAIMAVKRNGVALKGNIHTDLENLKHVAAKSMNVQLRVGLDVFANVIRCKSIPGVKTRHEDIDIAIIRENTEGEYSSLEHENVDGVVESLKIITEKRSMRIAEYAFNYAIKHGRKKVTAIHKANIMKLGDGLFLNSCRAVAARYPEIEFNDLIVDNCCMQLVSKPQQFDVMVMPNLYGNIIGNIGCGLVGGPGIVPGQNVGEDYAIFETATRNTGKTIAGRNLANPTATLLAGALLLDHLGLDSYAKAIRRATIRTLTEERIHTPDLGGQASTSDVVQHVISLVDKTQLTSQ